MEKTSVRKQKRLTKTYTNKDTSTPYNWDKDCAFYEKCRAKNNRLCHYCKENNTYIAK